MGMWDFEAWDNDSAADWFGSLMDVTKLREKWLEAISEAPEDEPEVSRAAIWLFAQLGRVYIWPIDHYDEDLKRAIVVGEKLIQLEELTEEVPEFVEKLQVDLNIIKSRCK